MGLIVFFCIVVFCLIQSSLEFHVCSTPADVYLVVETSGVDPSTLGLQKDFLQDLAPLFPLSSPLPTRVGVVTYGATPTLYLPLGAAPTVPLLKEAIQGITAKHGTRDMAQALRFLREHAFPEARSNVRHVTILITSGYSASDHQQREVAEEASALREQGVLVYVLTSGQASGADVAERIAELASSPAEDFVFSTDDQEIKRSLLELLNIRPCHDEMLTEFTDAVERKACAPRRETDMVFAVDHLALGTSKSRGIITFIQALLSETEPDSPLKTTLLTSSDPLPLTSVLSPTRFIHHTLSGLHFPDLGELLVQAGQLLSTSGSMDSQKVLVVFLDDKQQSVDRKVIATARLIKNTKVDIYVVYLYQEGGWVKNDMADVFSLASGDDHVISIPGYFRQLREERTLVKETLMKVCTGL